MMFKERAMNALRGWCPKHRNNEDVKSGATFAPHDSNLPNAWRVTGEFECGMAAANLVTSREQALAQKARKV